MPILDKNNVKEVERYEEFVKNSRASFMQSTKWAKVKTNWESEYVYIEEDGKIKACMSILLERVKKTKFYLAYSPRGPIGCDIKDVETVEKLVKEAEKLREKYNIFVFKFDPNIKYDETISKMYSSKGFKVLNKNVSKDDLIQPLHDMILYLDGYDEDGIFKTFSEKTRYNTRLSKRKGVEVYYSNDEKDLKIFYELYKITSIRDRLVCRSYEYFKNMLEAFDKDQIRIYITKHEEDYLSAAITLNYGGEVFYLYGASSNVKRNLMPNYSMQWEMIKWAFETKAHIYNFGGVLELNPDDGLYKFKIGFCKKDGITEYLGEIDKVYNNFVYFGFRYVLPVIKKVKRFFRNVKRDLAAKR